MVRHAGDGRAGAGRPGSNGIRYPNSPPRRARAARRNSPGTKTGAFRPPASASPWARACAAPRETALPGPDAGPHDLLAEGFRGQFDDPVDRHRAPVGPRAVLRRTKDPVPSTMGGPAGRLDLASDFIGLSRCGVHVPRRSWAHHANRWVCGSSSASTQKSHQRPCIRKMCGVGGGHVAHDRPQVLPVVGEPARAEQATSRAADVSGMQYVSPPDLEEIRVGGVDGQFETSGFSVFTPFASHGQRCDAALPRFVVELLGEDVDAVSVGPAEGSAMKDPLSGAGSQRTSMRSPSTMDSRSARPRPRCSTAHAETGPSRCLSRTWLRARAANRTTSRWTASPRLCSRRVSAGRPAGARSRSRCHASGDRRIQVGIRSKLGHEPATFPRGPDVTPSSASRRLWLRESGAAESTLRGVPGPHAVAVDRRTSAESITGE